MNLGVLTKNMNQTINDFIKVPKVHTIRKKKDCNFKWYTLYLLKFLKFPKISYQNWVEFFSETLCIISFLKNGNYFPENNKSLNLHLKIHGNSTSLLNSSGSELGLQKGTHEKSYLTVRSDKSTGFLDVRRKVYHTRQGHVVRT